MNATILRPWYVLGPGHYWPYFLKPGYWLARQVPSLRESATRLGLVTWKQMIAALASSVETPLMGIRVVEVPEIAGAVVPEFWDHGLDIAISLRIFKVDGQSGQFLEFRP